MLRLSVFLSDYLGRVLLMHDAPTNRLILPSVSLEPGHLPMDLLAESIRLSTGIIAMPVRLTGIYSDADDLTLVFRAVQRGGALTTGSDGRPVAGFFDANPTPQPMTAAIQQQVQDALRHTGGPPICASATIRLGERFRRVLGADKPAPGDIDWSVVVNVIVRDPAGNILWQREPGHDHLRLPSAAVPAGSLPCDIARKLIHKLDGTAIAPVLSGIYVHRDEPVVELAYVAGAADGSTYDEVLLPQSDSGNYDPSQVMQVQQALRGLGEIDFAIWPETSGSATGPESHG